MSANNFMAVIQEGKRWVGYHCCASHPYPYINCFKCIGAKAWTAGKIKQAIRLCEKEEYLECGYRFPQLSENMETAPTSCTCETKKFIEEIEK